MCSRSRDIPDLSVDRQRLSEILRAEPLLSVVVRKKRLCSACRRRLFGRYVDPLPPPDCLAYVDAKQVCLGEPNHAHSFAIWRRNMPSGERCAEKATVCCLQDESVSVPDGNHAPGDGAAAHAGHGGWIDSVNVLERRRVEWIARRGSRHANGVNASQLHSRAEKVA